MTCALALALVLSPVTIPPPMHEHSRTFYEPAEDETEPEAEADDDEPSYPDNPWPWWLYETTGDDSLYQAWVASREPPRLVVHIALILVPPLAPSERISLERVRSDTGDIARRILPSARPHQSALGCAAGYLFRPPPDRAALRIDRSDDS